jgi:hypothetical protein
VRETLGVPDGVPLAAVYLNPHFKDPSIAAAVEEGLARAGFRVHAVGEGYRARPGWMGTDAHFADVVHAAELFVSGAGMGALELARSSGTPLLVLLGDQPEQARNVLVGDPELARSIAVAAAALVNRGTPPGRPSSTAAEAPWVEAFLDLVRAARVVTGGRRALVAHPRPAF